MKREELLQFMRKISERLKKKMKYRDFNYLGKLLKLHRNNMNVNKNILHTT